jgi:pimeloyl-ACP methyl ester carboxylesterase
MRYPRRRIALFVWILCAAMTGPAIAGDRKNGADEHSGEANRPTIHINDQTETVTLTVRATDGELAWGDLMRGLSRLNGFDDKALAGLLPEETIDLDAWKTAWLIESMDRSLGEPLSLAIQDDADGPALKVTLDRAAHRANKRELKRRIRAAAGTLRQLLGDDRAEPEPGLVLPDGWQARDASKPVVIFVHGFNPKGNGRAGWLGSLREAGFATGWFRYRNEGPIDKAGQRLAKALRRFGERHPDREVALVTFSMGGLVARAAIEYPDRAPDNVSRLIMVAPPNHGSDLAVFGFALEVTRYVQDLDKGDPISRFMKTLEDGLGEASNDLEPGSLFLRRLNAQKRHPEVTYTIILGTRGPLPAGHLASLRDAVDEAGEANRLVQFVRPNVQAALDLEELVRGRGDGAVSLESGRLAGVADVVTLPFDHRRALNRASDDRQARKIHNAVRRRLLAGDPEPGAGRP